MKATVIVWDLVRPQQTALPKFRPRCPPSIHLKPRHTHVTFCCSWSRYVPGGRRAGEIEFRPTKTKETRTSPFASLGDLRQVRTYQLAPIVQAACIAPWAVAVELLLPLMPNAL